MNLFRLKDSNHTNQKFNGSALLPVAVVLACFIISPMAKAVVPAPDGGYPGGNTAEGDRALLSLTSGGYNTAVGLFSLRSNTSGSLNTAVGAGTLVVNTGDQNTATGPGALFSNTTASGNTADGAFALFSNTTGVGNTATGLQALFSNAGGIRNTANGVYALNHNVSGVGNTAIGYQALANSTGNGNTAIGNDSLVANTTGSANVAIGVGAGSGITTSNNVICIGIGGVEHDNTTWVGNIWNVQPLHPNVAPVVVSDHGQLCVQASSERFKKDISTMGKASETILSLRPVSFHYKNDAKDTAQFGLIAEEVAKVNPALVLPDKEGKPFTVRYDQVNAMLLNEFLKEHRKVQEQGATIAQLKNEIATVVVRLKEQDSKIQRVSAHIELSEAVAQTALNNP